MRFQDLLSIVKEEPVFESTLLMSGDVDPEEVRVQLSRWTRSGKLFQLRRGLYSLAPPYQKTKPHPFLMANRMVVPSYISLESALAFYGLIPEYVAQTTSVTAARPQTIRTTLGSFDFRHIQQLLFFGYHTNDLPESQNAFLAVPEKALLDLVYLREGADSRSYLEELRLQNLDRLDIRRLEQMAERSNKSKLRRAARIIGELAQAETMESVTL